MSDYMIGSVEGQSERKTSSKQVAVKPEVHEENLDSLVEQFTKLDAELKRHASEVDAFKKKDLGIIVRAAEVVYKAKSSPKRKTYTEFCERVGLKGARKRRYAKIGERADRLNANIDQIKNEIAENLIRT